MNKVYKILGQRCRVTIPYEIRSHQNFVTGDIISFEEKDDSVIIKRVKICDGCRKVDPEPVNKPTDEITLLDLLDGLTVAEQRAAFIHLLIKWTSVQGGDLNVHS